jgi:molybdate transport system substrate-binding protein
MRFRSFFTRSWWQALLCGLLVSACAAPPQPQTLTVFAASSLTDAFKELGAQFEVQHPGTQVIFNFAGSQQLRQQLEQGAQADVFASANAKEMDVAIQSGLVVAGAPQVFVKNHLTVIVPKDNRAGVTTLSDLAKPGLKIVLAAPGVPVGGYALNALDKMNLAFGEAFSSTVLSNVVSYEDNVKQVVAKVQLGEADAGIVYTSDVTPAAVDQLRTIDIPDEFNVVATYPIAPLNAASQSALGRDFVQGALSASGQSILKKWGFSTP